MLGAGIGLTATGGLLVLVMFVHLLHWIAPDFPLWACYGTVGGVLVAAGGILCYLAKKGFAEAGPLPRQSIAALKENVQWITNPK